MNNNGFLTVKDIAEIFKISTQAVYEWMKDNRLKFYQVTNTKRIRPEDLLQYLKDRGNSEIAMKDFKYEIDKCLEKKALAEKGSKIEFDIFSDKGEKRIVGYEKGKNDDPFKSDPFKDFEESKEAKKYINEAETSEEKAERFAKVKNYIKGTGKKPWGKQ